MKKIQDAVLRQSIREIDAIISFLSYKCDDLSYFLRSTATLQIEEGFEEVNYFSTNLKLITSKVGEVRLKLLGESKPDWEERARPIVGRILASHVEISLSDGMSKQLTRGFLNIDNIAPWWTWLSIDKIEGFESNLKTIYSWVPLHLTEFVNDAIDMNPEESIQWATDYVLVEKEEK